MSLETIQFHSLTLQVGKWRPRKDSGHPEVTELVVAPWFSLPGTQSRDLFSIAGCHFSLALFPKLNLGGPAVCKLASVSTHLGCTPHCSDYFFGKGGGLL